MKKILILALMITITGQWGMTNDVVDAPVSEIPTSQEFFWATNLQTYFEMTPEFKEFSHLDSSDYLPLIKVLESGRLGESKLTVDQFRDMSALRLKILMKEALPVMATDLNTKAVKLTSLVKKEPSESLLNDIHHHDQLMQKWDTDNTPVGKAVRVSLAEAFWSAKNVLITRSAGEIQKNLEIEKARNQHYDYGDVLDLRNKENKIEDPGIAQARKLSSELYLIVSADKLGNSSNEMQYAYTTVYHIASAAASDQYKQNEAAQRILLLSLLNYAHKSKSTTPYFVLNAIAIVGKATSYGKVREWALKGILDANIFTDYHRKNADFDSESALWQKGLKEVPSYRTWLDNTVYALGVNGSKPVRAIAANYYLDRIKSETSPDGETAKQREIWLNHVEDLTRELQASDVPSLKISTRRDMGEIGKNRLWREIKDRPKDALKIIAGLALSIVPAFFLAPYFSSSLIWRVLFYALTPYLVIYFAREGMRFHSPNKTALFLVVFGAATALIAGSLIHTGDLMGWRSKFLYFAWGFGALTAALSAITDRRHVKLYTVLSLINLLAMILPWIGGFFH